MDDIPNYIAGVLKTLEANGHEAYLVGGCLRDILLGRTVHDWDVATSAPGREIIRIFPKTVKTGARFGTVTVITGGGVVEVTTFRSEGRYSDRRRPDSVTFVSDLHEDLKRRDFTVNAMAMGADGALIDPFDGQGDLARRLIRCVGDAEERFSEDALRMFRALRFSAQLSFDIDTASMAAVKKCAPLCASLSAERIREETEKILLSEKPERIGEAVSIGLFKGRLKNGKLKPEKLRRLVGLSQTAVLRWCAFCALLAEENLIASPESFLRSMRLDTKTIRCCTAGIKAAQTALPEGRAEAKRLLAEIGADAAMCAASAEKALRDIDMFSTLNSILHSGECWSVRGLAVGGDDLLELGFKKGAAIGEALNALLHHVIEQPEDNERERLIKLAQRLRG